MESGRWYLFSLLLHYISYIDVEVVIMAMLNRKNETSAQTPATKRDYNDLSRLHDEIDAMFDNFFAPSFFEREPFQKRRKKRRTNRPRKYGNARTVPSAAA